MSEPRMSGTKRCTRCGEEKHVVCFPVDRRHTDGLGSWCQACKSRSEVEKRRGPLAKCTPNPKARRKVAGVTYWTQR